MYWKSVYKEKEKRYRVFDTEINDSNDDDFFSKSEQKEKVSNEIAALFKKTVMTLLYKWDVSKLELRKNIYTLIIVKWSLCKLTAVNLYQKSVYKDKEKRYRVFNTKISDGNDNDFFFKFNKKKKVSNKIAALFKKIVMILLYKWDVSKLKLKRNIYTFTIVK